MFKSMGERAHRLEQQFPSNSFWDLPDKEDSIHCNMVPHTPKSSRCLRKIPWSLVSKTTERLRRTSRVALSLYKSLPRLSTRVTKWFLCQSQVWSQIERNLGIFVNWEEWRDLNTIAPECSISDGKDRRAPCFSKKLPLMKHCGSQPERHWRKSKSAEHRTLARRAHYRSYAMGVMALKKWFFQIYGVGGQTYMPYNIATTCNSGERPPPLKYQCIRLQNFCCQPCLQQEDKARKCLLHQWSNPMKIQFL